jgi:hypothetical protein
MRKHFSKCNLSNQHKRQVLQERFRRIVYLKTPFQRHQQFRFFANMLTILEQSLKYSISKLSVQLCLGTIK